MIHTALKRLRLYTGWITYLATLVVMGVLYPALARLWGGFSWPVASSAARFSLRALGIQVECTGEAALLIGGGRIIVANHRSWFDSIALAAVSPQRLRFLAKRGYFRMPVVGAMLRAYGHIPVHYDSSQPLKLSGRRTLEQALADGQSLVIYPEGTRSHGPALLPFKDGAWRVAADTQLPIIAVYISGAEAVWPKGARLKDLRPNVIRIKVWELNNVHTDSVGVARQGAEEEFKWLHKNDAYRPRVRAYS